MYRVFIVDWTEDACDVKDNLKVESNKSVILSIAMDFDSRKYTILLQMHKQNTRFMDDYSKYQ